MWEEERESAGVVSTVSYSLLHSVPHSFNKFEQGERFLVCMCVCVCDPPLSRPLCECASMKGGRGKEMMKQIIELFYVLINSVES